MLKRALRNIKNNQFLHLVSAGTVALVLLILGAFMLIFLNLNQAFGTLKEDVHIIAYLKDGLEKSGIKQAGNKIKELQGVSDAVFVSADQAFARLKDELKHQSAILDGLQENPLPPSFEISLIPSFKDQKEIENLVDKIATLEDIADVQYGQEWLGR
ncbi:MAG: permease-like cell division protein FtsX, partial [Pseudomonadota bacterium]